MDLENKALEAAKRTVSIEAQAVNNLINSIDSAFAKAVLSIHNSNGRVIITGIGKSAIIAQKMVATMNSTGTPAIFMHAADAIHGDLGIIQKNDVVVCLSKSGNTPEIKVLVPLIKDFGNLLIAITSHKDSFLGKEADFILHAPIEEEACPNGLAPTTSTTAQLVIGDALAVSLLELKGFSDKDFAKYHPGGALGKKLYLRVDDLVSQNKKPEVSATTSLREVIINISENMLGMTVVTSESKAIGVITDGDLRRMLTSGRNIDDLQAHDIMSDHPKTIDTDAMAVEARETMEEYNISQLVATNNGEYAGVVHIHDLIREGIL
ncbi:arabinose 5-phosphate isomerase [Nonlabens tegetincola]|uniref:Arabinose 5-phosphate isomerase n=1 Tax=Nonlabens tegetincola TaxID=323273 RepID=A0A090Q5E3_9FLAO|nr:MULTISPECIES: KpsF/GutQ family sugar-phosphate isomerase [Nonlabens]ALM21912.1 D-arabinose 5-phosphate isomerase [Nonlabens sp. MIC269]MEE2800892.1 KpsF/GutQ family sugar-phosphate isomerase [Bacteroidota bacterium]PQJ17233.1 D-arabinose 5-phosphate isomerase [Nonlabens tegetincola]GAK98230.1 arabinose 5-phosphate isomerase [Nonlabens tegetincola]